jgi:hypothetical protein
MTANSSLTADTYISPAMRRGPERVCPRLSLGHAVVDRRVVEHDAAVGDEECEQIELGLRQLDLALTAECPTAGDRYCRSPAGFSAKSDGNYARDAGRAGRREGCSQIRFADDHTTMARGERSTATFLTPLRTRA